MWPDKGQTVDDAAEVRREPPVRRWDLFSIPKGSLVPVHRFTKEPREEEIGNDLLAFLTIQQN